MVALFTFKPAPPELSAASPPKLAGTVSAVKAEPFAGVVTEALAGFPVSIVKVRLAGVLCTLPALSVARERTVYAPSDGGVKPELQEVVPLAVIHTSVALLNPSPFQ